MLKLTLASDNKHTSFVFYFWHYHLSFSRTCVFLKCMGSVTISPIFPIFEWYHRSLEWKPSDYQVCPFLGHLEFEMVRGGCQMQTLEMERRMKPLNADDD